MSATTDGALQLLRRVQAGSPNKVNPRFAFLGFEATDRTERGAGDRLRDGGEPESLRDRELVFVGEQPWRRPRQPCLARAIGHGRDLPPLGAIARHFPDFFAVHRPTTYSTSAAVVAQPS